MAPLRVRICGHPLRIRISGPPCVSGFVAPHCVSGFVAPPACQDLWAPRCVSGFVAAPACQDLWPPVARQDLCSAVAAQRGEGSEGRGEGGGGCMHVQLVDAWGRRKGECTSEQRRDRGSERRTRTEVNGVSVSQCPPPYSCPMAPAHAPRYARPMGEPSDGPGGRPPEAAEEERQTGMMELIGDGIRILDALIGTADTDTAGGGGEGGDGGHEGGTVARKAKESRDGPSSQESQDGAGSQES